MRVQVGTVLHDIRFALRNAARSPGFVITAVFTLALGMGANTAMFSVVSGVLLRPLPFAAPDRLVQLSQSGDRSGAGAVHLMDLEGWRNQSKALDGIAAYGNTARNLLDSGEPERIQAVWAERGLFQLLGVAPLMGRPFRADDPLDVVVIGARLWKRRFAADPAVIGRRITLDEQAYTVIGVMPAEFQFPYRTSLTELWIPWQAAAGSNPNRRADFAVARLKAGVTVAAGRAELNAIAQGWEWNRGRGVQVTPLSEVVAGAARPALLTLLGAVGLVLFIGCANVANLLLARAAMRSREVAVRTALGAGRWRLIRQFLTESVLLAFAGGLAGLLFAFAGTRLILRVAAGSIPRASEIGVDWRVFLFLLATSLATGIAFGLVPALAATGRDVHAALKEAGGGRASGSGVSGWSSRRVRDSLVVVEIAFSFVLLVSAGLALRAFLRLQETPAGLAPDRVLTQRLSVSMRDYSAPGSYGRYTAQLEERLRSVPGVRAAGFIQFLPLQNWGWWGYFSIPGGSPEPAGQGPKAELRYVSPGYFDALRIPVRRGRTFTERDNSDSPRVIVVNEALARTYFGNSDPVGRVTDRGTIVGVVGDVRSSALDKPASPEIYYSFAQNTAATSDAGVTLVVSTRYRPEALASAVRDAIRQVNPRQVIYDVRTMDAVIAGSLADVRLYVWLVGLFAALAVLLAASGVYGVVAFVVAVRTPEFGLRVALGAGGPQILRLVLRQGAWLVGCGLAAGAAGAFGATRLMESLVRGVRSPELPVLVAAALMLAISGLAACLVPARRAMRADPMEALK